MRKTLFLLLSLFLSFKSFAQPCKEIIGYYPNWQWYDRSKLVKPSTIQYSKYSIINYCFFKPEVNGLISNTDTWADENLLQGEINWSTSPVSYYPNTSIIDLAHNAGTKVMVSIGGWTLSDNFPSIAADPAKRATFAAECNRLLSFYKFDGIDIDWEYPGYVDHSGTPADEANFTIFMQQIRDSINALGARNGKTYLLSACFGASAAHASNIEWSNIVPILDMLNIMTYDYFGTWDHVANHNSPLYACGAGDPSFNLDATFEMLTTTYGVPAYKINLGVGFYGRSQTGASTLYGATSGSANTTLFFEDDGSPLYYNIVKNMSLFDRYWDAAADVPYLLGKPSGSAAGTFVSYDDEESIGLKAAYIRDNNARGAIIWEITGDYLETSPGSGIIAGTPLIDTLNATFCAVSSSPMASLIITSNDADNTICAGTNVTFTAVPTNGGSTPVYQWMINGTPTGTGGSTFSTTGLANGDEVSCTMTSSLSGVSGSPAVSNTITFTVVALPSTPIITLGTSGTTLVSSASTGNQWYLDGVLIPGATGNTYTPTASGIYTVVVTQSGCSSSASAGYNFTYLNAFELSNDVYFKVYPNPNNGEFYVQLNTNESNAVLSIKNSIGQIVYTVALHQKETHKIAAGTLTKGIYLVVIESNGLIQTEKITIN